MGVRIVPAIAHALQIAIATVFLASCSSSSSSSSSASGAPAPRPPTVVSDGHEIGHGDGSANSVVLTEIYAPGAASKLVDVAYYAERNELWAVGYGDDSIHIGSAFGTPSASFQRVVDPAAGHFMHKPPALAMGTPDRWATCGDNANEHAAMSDGDLALFMGPSLFSTDLSILGVPTPKRLGSHVDMLHNTPLCRGIAHERDNVYWVFNSLDRSLDRYDFHADHGPGNDDHSDGDIFRYAAGKVKGSNDGTPSHVFYDADDAFLYVADTGNARVVRLDTTKGIRGGQLPRQMERLHDQAVMEGTDVEAFVPAGKLTAPSGIEVHGTRVYVTDAATSTFHVYDKQGNELRHLETGLPPGSLAGFTFAGDGKIYFADRIAGRIVRIDPS